jgi:hypothetical protein
VQQNAWWRFTNGSYRKNKLICQSLLFTPNKFNKKELKSFNNSSNKVGTLKSRVLLKAKRNANTLKLK